MKNLPNVPSCEDEKSLLLRMDAGFGDIVPNSAGGARHLKALAPRIALDKLGRIFAMRVVQLTSSSPVNTRVVRAGGATGVTTITAELSAAGFRQISTRLFPRNFATGGVKATNDVFAGQIAAAKSTVWFAAVSQRKNDLDGESFYGRVGFFAVISSSESEHVKT